MYPLKLVARTLFAALAVAGCMAAIANAAPMVNDPNLLQGLAATPSNQGHSSDFDTTNYNVAFATNLGGGGAGLDFVFAQGDPDQRLAITGFNAQIGTLRLWTATDLAPQNITLYTSTSSTNSIVTAGYGSPFFSVTTPSYITGTGTSAGLEYFDITNLPVGTQTILFEFLNEPNQANGTGFRRIAEVQGFAPVPEPASLVLFGLGVAGLFAVARRRRKA